MPRLGRVFNMYLDSKCHSKPASKKGLQDVLSLSFSPFFQDHRHCIHISFFVDFFFSFSFVWSLRFLIFLVEAGDSFSVYPVSSYRDRKPS